MAHKIIFQTQKNVRMSKYRIKTMLMVFFDVQGIINFEFVPQGNEMKIFNLQHDNAPRHMAFVATHYLTQNKTPVVPQPLHTGSQWRTSKLTYKVPQRHSSRGDPGCFPGMTESIPQV
ncbi:hypothetical protein J6590_060370 [Homalodisca vitripennis]|nr:hypothetical protein J6590_060370 [Homalodisca vitripennis]